MLKAHAKANDYLIDDYNDCISLERIQKLQNDVKDLRNVTAAASHYSR